MLANALALAAGDATSCLCASFTTASNAVNVSSAMTSTRFFI
jgi:hypothetical protein